MGFASNRAAMSLSLRGGRPPDEDIDDDHDHVVPGRGTGSRRKSATGTAGKRRRKDVEEDMLSLQYEQAKLMR